MPCKATQGSTSVSQEAEEVEARESLYCDFHRKKQGRQSKKVQD